MRLRGIFRHQQSGFLQGKRVHAGIGQGFDVADTIIVVIRRKATRLFPERQGRLPRFLISPGLRDGSNAAGGQRHINAVTLPDLNNLVIMTRPGCNL